MTGRVPGDRRRKAERHGRLAEHLAAWLLRLKAYRIIERRARTAKGEIDIIAVRGRTLVFVEVKARATHDQALEAVNQRQAGRIVDAANVWLARNPKAQDHNCRFDIITVSPYLWPKHLANAFGDELW